MIFLIDMRASGCRSGRDFDADDRHGVSVPSVRRADDQNLYRARKTIADGIGVPLDHAIDTPRGA